MLLKGSNRFLWELCLLHRLASWVVVSRVYIEDWGGIRLDNVYLLGRTRVDGSNTIAIRSVEL